MSALSGKVATGGVLNAYASLLNADSFFSPVTAPPPPSDPVSLPTAPSSLTVLNNKNQTANLTWQDNSTNESEFVIERQKSSSGGRWSGSTFITVAANTEIYTDKSGAGTFRYRISAINEAGSSSATEWVQQTITKR